MKILVNDAAKDHHDDYSYSFLSLWVELKFVLVGRSEYNHIVYNMLMILVSALLLGSVLSLSVLLCFVCF